MEKFRKGDLIAVAIVLLFAVAVGVFYWPKGEAGTVQVYQDGTLVYHQSLSQDGSFTVTGKYTNVIEIRHMQAYIAESDCPGNDCVHMGSASKNRSVVCLPNRVEVRVVAQGGDGADFAVR